MNEMPIQEVRDLLAEMCGLKEDVHPANTPGLHYHLPRGGVCYVKDWQPDQNPEFAELVKRKWVQRDGCNYLIGHTFDFNSMIARVTWNTGKVAITVDCTSVSGEESICRAIAYMYKIMKEFGE